MSEAPPQHREEFRVRSYEVEPDGRLRVVVLLRMMQEAAWQHANMLGRGFSQRQEGEMFWVLSRLRLTVDRYPRWGERLAIRTFPVGTEKLFALREFALHGESDEIVGRAASGWLIVDGGRGRPVRPQAIVEDIVLSEREHRVGLDRIDPPADESREEGPFRVRYHDIDQYRHVNNAAYLEWVLDALDPDRVMSMEVEELGLDFLKETLLDDTYRVRIRSERADDIPIDRFEIIRSSDGEACVRGFVRWRHLARAVDHAEGRR